MKFRNYIYIIVLFFLSKSAFCQENKNYYTDEFSELNFNKSNVENSFAKNKKLSLFDKERFDFRLTTGVSYMNLDGFGLFSTYAKPEIRYKITGKFSISAGMLASINYLPSVSKNSENSIPMSSKMYSYAYFVQGEYQASNKINIYGTVFYAPSNFGKQDFIFTNVGFEYKITEHIHFEAGMSFSKGIGFNTQYGYSPFNSRLF